MECYLRHLGQQLHSSLYVFQISTVVQLAVFLLSIFSTQKMQQRRPVAPRFDLNVDSNEMHYHLAAEFCLLTASFSSYGMCPFFCYFDLIVTVPVLLNSPVLDGCSYPGQDAVIIDKLVTYFPECCR